MMMIRIRIIRKQLRIIIGVNTIITIAMKTMRVARMIMRMIKAMRVTDRKSVV